MGGGRWAVGGSVLKALGRWRIKIAHKCGNAYKMAYRGGIWGNEPGKCLKQTTNIIRNGFSYLSNGTNIDLRSNFYMLLVQRMHNTIYIFKYHARF